MTHWSRWTLLFVLGCLLSEPITGPEWEKLVPCGQWPNEAVSAGPQEEPTERCGVGVFTYYVRKSPHP